MTGSQIDLTTAKCVIDDAASLGIRWIRFYGGEPLAHRDLGLMVKHAASRGVRSWISTNALLLNDSRFKELRQAGLQGAAIGWYGCDQSYDWYAQRPGAYEVLLRNLGELRRCDETFALSIRWLLAAHTCSLEELHKVWKVAERFDAEFHVDIVHEDGALPYFTDGPDGCLGLEDCIPSVHEIVAELVRLRRSFPNRYKEPLASIRSIPDWIIRQGTLDVPCDMNNHIWIGPDGSVRLCYAGFPLGNVNGSRLADILYTRQHKEAARSSFVLDCPRCQCNRDTRIKRDVKARLQYGWS